MALIPPFFIDTVIAIGKQTGAGVSIHKQWIGTGFIYATFQNVNSEDSTKSDYKIHLLPWLAISANHNSQHCCRW